MYQHSMACLWKLVNSQPTIDQVLTEYQSRFWVGYWSIFNWGSIVGINQGSINQGYRSTLNRGRLKYTWSISLRLVAKFCFKHLTNCNSELQQMSSRHKHIHVTSCTFARRGRLNTMKKFSLLTKFPDIFSTMYKPEHTYLSRQIFQSNTNWKWGWWIGNLAKKITCC